MKSVTVKTYCKCPYIPTIIYNGQCINLKADYSLLSIILLLCKKIKRY